MRRLNNCFLIVIFIAIVISGWSLDHRIATARVFLHHVANQLPSSPEVIGQEHETVDNMQTNYLQQELVETKKPIQRFNHDFKKVLQDRSAKEGHKSQLELIASIATTIGGSMFVIVVVLLVCAKKDESSPQKVETPLLCQDESETETETETETQTETETETKKDDIAETRELGKGVSFHTTSIKQDTNKDTNSTIVPEIVSDAPTTSIPIPPLKPPPGKEIVLNNNVVVFVPTPPPPRANPAPATPPPPNSAPQPPPPSNSRGPPPPPNPRAPPAPPGPGGTRGPPVPPPKGGGPRVPAPANAMASSNKTKLKPFFWDKVNASPQQTMVWDEIQAGSFVFNEDMIETLFGITPDEKKGNDRKAKSAAPTVIHLIEAKKSQNLSILLKALNVTTKEVCDALMEGNELPIELLQTLLKMQPTSDEELKLRLFNGDPSLISPGERFLKALVDIQFSYKRMECLLFMITLREELSGLKESFAILETASDKLRSCRVFLKLLEAVLKTGNRMNDGTYRGGAHAFKLDTLLKLADVKGKDGKTTLLHFVVQEMVKSEGIKAARAANANCSVSSINSDDYSEEATLDPTENFQVVGLQVVSGLSTELEVIKKAAIIDSDALTSTAARLGHSLLNTKNFLNREMKDLGEESRFHRALKDFVEESEIEITKILQEERRIMDLVKKTVDYFHGNSAKEEGLRLFVIVRDFMVLLDKICADIQKTINQPPKTSKEKTKNAASNNRQQSSDHSANNASNPNNKDGTGASTSGTSSTNGKSIKESSAEESSQESQPQASSSSSISEQVTKTLSQERAVEEMRQKLLPITQASQSDESSSSSDDETTKSGKKGSSREVPFQEGYSQASSSHQQKKEKLSQEIVVSSDDSSSSSSDGS